MKRLLSALIAIILIATMIPQSLAAETDEKDYTYVFSNNAFEGEKVTRSELAEMTYNSLNVSVTDLWKVAGTRYINGVQSTDYGLMINAKHGRTSGVGCFVVEIYVPEGGTYTPSLEYFTRNSAPIVDVYLVKEGTTAGDYSTSDILFATNTTDHLSTFNFVKNLDEKYKLKNFDMWGNTTAFIETTTEYFGNVELKLDDNSKYYLIFRTGGKNDSFVAEGSNGLLYMYLKSFSLNHVGTGADDVFDYEEEDYTASSTTQVTALAAYGNGEAIADSEVISVTNVEYGKSCTVSVNNETVVKNDKTYKFSHWARGAATGANKMVLSSEAVMNLMQVKMFPISRAGKHL